MTLGADVTVYETALQAEITMRRRSKRSRPSDAKWTSHSYVIRSACIGQCGFHSDPWSSSSLRARDAVFRNRRRRSRNPFSIFHGGPASWSFGSRKSNNISSRYNQSICESSDQCRSVAECRATYYDPPVNTGHFAL